MQFTGAAVDIGVNSMDNHLQTIISNYRKLCEYCDSLWARVRTAYPNEITCREGCGICCELKSVNRIEAHVIKSHLEKSYRDDGNLGVISYHNDIDPHGSGSEKDMPPAPPSNRPPSACPFLHDHNQTCRIYEARPLICRTHGLILRSEDFGQKQAASCPYNFPSVHPKDMPQELAVDVDLITGNLTKLNLAFCMVCGVGVEDERVLLVNIK